MRARVVKLYRDKNSKRFRKIGEVIKMSEERFEEINSTSFGIFLERVEDLEDEQELITAEVLSSGAPTMEELSEKQTTAEEPPADELMVEVPPLQEHTEDSLAVEAPPMEASLAEGKKKTDRKTKK